MIKKILLPLCLSLFAMCNEENGNNPTTPTCTPISTAVEIVYPKGGETFKVGDDVNIQWKANPAKISSGSVTVQVSINSGKTWKYIKNTGINVPQGDVACMSYIWRVGSEYETVAYTETQSAIIRIGNYGDPEAANGESVAFTVKK